MRHISSRRSQYSIELWVKLLPIEWLWSVLNPTHIIFVYLIRFVELARTMHQRLFFLEFLYFTGSHKVWQSKILTIRMTCSCIPVQALARVAPVACYSKGCRLPASRIDVTWWSPTAHPRKCLGRGMVDGPQTIAANTRGEREGYTLAAFSLQSS